MSQLEQIELLEQRLFQAMLTSDVAELDDLLSDDLLAIGPDGQPASKADDLATHRAGIIHFTAMTPLQTTIKLWRGDCVCVNGCARHFSNSALSGSIPLHACLERPTW